MPRSAKRNGWSPDLARRARCISRPRSPSRSIRANAVSHGPAQFGNGRNLVPAHVRVARVDRHGRRHRLAGRHRRGAGRRRPRNAPPEMNARLWQHCAAHAPELAAKRIDARESEGAARRAHPAVPDDGDGRGAEAARHVHPASRRLRAADGEGEPGTLACAAADAGGRAGQPAGPRAVGHDAGASADRARGGEPDLADVFRRRAGRDQRRLRLAGRVAESSGTARLAGGRFRRARLGREGAGAADRHCRRRTGRSRPRRPRRSSAIRRTGCSPAGRVSVCRPSSFATRR